MTLFHIIITLHLYTQNQTKLKMDIHSLNVIRQDFTTHLMQQLSHHLRKQTPFSPHLQKSIYLETDVFFREIFTIKSTSVTKTISF